MTSYRGKYPNRIKMVSGAANDQGVVVTTNIGGRFRIGASTVRGSNQMPKPGDDIAIYINDMHHWVIFIDSHQPGDNA